MSTSNLHLFKESPLSWKIWLGFWILPLLITVPFTYLVDPVMAIVMGVLTGGIVYTMIFKPEWTKRWTLIVVILDLFSFVFVIGLEQMTSSVYGAVLKEIIFLLYLYYSTNSVAYQERFKQKKKNDFLDADFKSD